MSLFFILLLLSDVSALFKRLLLVTIVKTVAAMVSATTARISELMVVGFISRTGIAVFLLVTFLFSILLPKFCRP